MPAEIAPLFQHLPWLDRVWPMPRRRGRASLRETWPLIRALRREHFDRSVDFASNDRGAILSLLIGARRRLGWDAARRIFGPPILLHRPRRAGDKLRSTNPRGWRNCCPAGKFRRPLRWNRKSAPIRRWTPRRRNCCRRPRRPLPHGFQPAEPKEWPLRALGGIYRLAAAAGLPVAFTTARGDAKRALMDELKQLVARRADSAADAELPLFLAVLTRAEVFISGDTGPLHFAAGLGVPTISLFGPSDPERFSPRGTKHQFLKTAHCSCGPAESRCLNADYCLGTITAEQVFAVLAKMVEA